MLFFPTPAVRKSLCVCAEAIRFKFFFAGELLLFQIDYSWNFGHFSPYKTDRETERNEFKMNLLVIYLAAGWKIEIKKIASDCVSFIFMRYCCLPHTQRHKVALINAACTKEPNQNSIRAFVLCVVPKLSRSVYSVPLIKYASRNEVRTSKSWRPLTIKLLNCITQISFSALCPFSPSNMMLLTSKFHALRSFWFCSKS